MRFKTKDLMINVRPADMEVMEADYGKIACYGYTPYQCQWFSRGCNWGTPCPRPTPFCHVSRWWEACGAVSIHCPGGTGGGCHPSWEDPEDIVGITPRIRETTPILLDQPEIIDVLKTELAATQQLLAKIEAEVAAPRSLAEVKQVEAGLVEALAQVRAQKKNLAKRTPVKKAPPKRG